MPSIRKLFELDSAGPFAPEVELRRAQALVNQGIAAEASGRTQEALQCYRSAIQADPRYAPAHMNLGIALHALGELASALASHRQAIELDPGHAAARYNLALACLEAGEPAQAEAQFREAVRLRFEFPEAWVGLAQALEARGRDPDALAALDTAIGQREHYAGAQFNASVLLQKMGRLEAAQARLREIDLSALYASPDRHAELESVAQQMVLVWPDYALGWRALGIVLALQSRFGEAVPALEKALKGVPDDPQTLNTLGVALEALGQHTQAEASFRRAIALHPDFHEAHANLGRFLLVLGRSPEAETSFRRALDVEPADCKTLNHLGTILQSTGRPSEAVATYTLALALKPDFPEAHNNLGNALRDLHRLSEAESSYRRALGVDPDFHQAHNNLGIFLQSLGRTSEAEASCRRAVELAPDSWSAHYSLGRVMQSCGKATEAEASFRLALTLAPEDYVTHNSLGVALQTLGRYAEAKACYRRALELKPDSHVAHGNLGVPLYSLGRVPEAEASFRRALEIDPDFREARSNLLFTLNYTNRLSPAELFKEHLEWARRHEAPLAARRLPHSNKLEPQRKLRVGYVSPDFRRHSVAYFIEPLLARHDRNHFEVFSYASVSTPDAMTEHLLRLSDFARDISSMSDADAADMVREDGIDILVDLAGHTSGGRLGLFALKPAPAQVTYLGYPNTTGLGAIGWRLTDVHADPPGEGDGIHTERLVRLARTFLCFQPPDSAPEIGPPPSLDRGYLTFGSFNTLPKITSEVIATWARLMQRVRGSRLMLKASGLSGSAGIGRLVVEFATHGIDQDRLILLGKVGNFNAHLETYHQVDIGLDTFPYNGTTTTFEAAWMGVPVVTLAGDRHAARVGASILSNLGLGVLIATSVDQYLSIAEGLATDRARLASLRKTMRERMQASPVRDEIGFTRAVEHAYRQMWLNWCDEAGAHS